METMSFSDIFAKTFQFKSPVVDALALALPAHWTWVHTTLRRAARNRNRLRSRWAKYVESYQKISLSFERHSAIVRLANLEAFQKLFTDVMTLFPLAKKTLPVPKNPLVDVLHFILVDEHQDSGETIIVLI
ncbi:hypothetical protein PC128_g25091 [Phytophthora cactorum]|nr:hypothetical protein PC128_g25091 [Phytophthora cactorum]